MRRGSAAGTGGDPGRPLRLRGRRPFRVRPPRRRPHPAAEREEVARADHDLEVVHRALEEVGGAGVQRPQAEGAVVVGGDDHQRDVPVVRHRAEAPGELGPVHARHLVVGDDQIDAVVLQPLQRVRRVGEHLCGNAVLDRRGQPGVDVPVGGAVVEDQDGGHDSTSPRAAARARGRPSPAATLRDGAATRMQRDVDVAHQAGGRPGEGHLAAELVADGGFDDARTEARRSGVPATGGAAGLLPAQAQARPGRVSCQDRASVPSGTERLPYLAALVASSCSAIERGWAVSGASNTGGPLSRTWELLPFPTNGANSPRSIARKSAPVHRDSVKSVCARASADTRPSTALANSGIVSARVSRSTACTTARAFLARWSTSRMSSAWRSSAPCGR
jgi:hypothetical protein